MITVYNSHHPRMLLRRCACPILAIGVVLLLAAATAQADDWSSPARTLAQKISGVTGPGAIALEVTNRSSLKASEVAQVRNTLAAELERLGLHVVENGQSETVHVTFSENARSYLWIAEVRQGGEKETVVMVSVPGSPSTNFTPGSSLHIHRTLLWSQETPILDATILAASSPEQMILLDPENITLYVNNNGRWGPEQAFPIAHAHPWPRDLRGRIALSKEHLFDAYLPEVICQAALTSPLSMNCRQADDAWPLIPSNSRAFFSQTRNFFTGVVAPAIGGQNPVPPFYSAAALPADNYTLWVFSRVDRSVHLLDGVSDVAAQVSWGSDIAAVKNLCGSGWQVLATSDRNESGDSLRAYQIMDREPTMAASPMDFNGPLTALWSKDDGSAVAIVHNQDTGKYDAFSVAVDCNQ